MLFAWKVNSSLAALGISPGRIKPEFRQSMQAAGRASGNSPQEIAIWIAGQLPLAERAQINPAPIKGWIRERKIDPQLAEMREAFDRLGLDVR
jgi:hypothetical protein